MKLLLNDDARFLSSFAIISDCKNSIIKKIILVGLFAFSNFTVAQKSEDNQYIYDSADAVSEADTYPGNPGDPNPAPIDDYIPALFIIGITFAIGVSMKKRANVE